MQNVCFEVFILQHDGLKGWMCIKLKKIVGAGIHDFNFERLFLAVTFFSFFSSEIC